MSNISMNQRLNSLTVGELLELIHKAVREEVVHILFEANSELIAEQPPIRDVGTIVEKMEATGKYKRSFLDSLRKGMERSRTFRSTTINDYSTTSS